MKKRAIIKEIVYWNKKMHIHLGLALTLFLWLFSFSGLLLNHSNWKFTSFWEQRKQNIRTLSLMVPLGLDSAGLIMWVKQKVNAKGEVSEVRSNADSLDFRVAVPGHLHGIHVDFKKSIITDKEISFNIWGVLRTLHTSNGVDKNDITKPSNWWLSTAWRFSMDAVAVGLILLCVSSYIMWYRLKKGRALGFMLLGAGMLGAVYFVWLLKIMETVKMAG